MGRKPRLLQDRFEEKYIPEPMSGCWLWIGCTDSDGYGKIGSKNPLDIERAHRISWIIKNGQIPDGILVCHKCDVRCCVNPNHLFLGTHKDNTHDMIKKGRVGKVIHYNKIKTHCKHGHEFTENNIYRPKNKNHRRCKKCVAIKDKIRWKKLKERNKMWNTVK